MKLIIRELKGIASELMYNSSYMGRAGMSIKLKRCADQLERLPVVSAPRRMWVNQPSTEQPCHNLHGTNVLAMEDTDLCMRVFFLSGEVESQQIPKACLSEGWNTQPSEWCPSCKSEGPLHARSCRLWNWEPETHA